VCSSFYSQLSADIAASSFAFFFYAFSYDVTQCFSESRAFVCIILPANPLHHLLDPELGVTHFSHPNTCAHNELSPI